MRTPLLEISFYPFMSGNASAGERGGGAGPGAKAQGKVAGNTQSGAQWKVWRAGLEVQSLTISLQTACRDDVYHSVQFKNLPGGAPAAWILVRALVKTWSKNFDPAMTTDVLQHQGIDCVQELASF